MKKTEKDRHQELLKIKKKQSKQRNKKKKQL